MPSQLMPFLLFSLSSNWYYLVFKQYIRNCYIMALHFELFQPNTYFEVQSLQKRSSVTYISLRPCRCVDTRDQKQTIRCSVRNHKTVTMLKGKRA
jgi:hypothetical protein